MTFGPEQLGSDPGELLAPLAEAVTELAGQQRYEEAGAVRDDAERLRALMERHRRVEALRSAGRVVLAVDGEGEVVLDDGLWVGSAGDGVGSGEVGPGEVGPGEVGSGEVGPDDESGQDQERAIVAQWLGSHAEMVRILEVGSPTGICMPARRIPALVELTGRGTATVGPRLDALPAPCP
jgi:hypothetical protein